MYVWGTIMKSLAAIFFLSLTLSVPAKAEETKSFWAKLVPDNSSALTLMDNGKSFFGQLFDDTKKTGKSLIDGGMDLINETGETIKSLGDGE